MAFVYSKGIKIHYVVEGKGAPLLLVHGLFGSLKSFYQNGYVEQLKNQYMLILVDIRGHGSSDRAHKPEMYSSKFFVDDLVAVLDDLNISKAHFFGYSMGGFIGFCAAKYAPERFISFIIGGWQPFNHKAGHSGSSLMEFVKEKGIEGVVAAMEETAEITPENKMGLLENDEHSIVAYLAHKNEHFENDLENLSHPFLLYSGIEDKVFGLVKACVGKMPIASFLPLDGDHYSVSMNIDPLLGEIRKFLSDY